MATTRMRTLLSSRHCDFIRDPLGATSQKPCMGIFLSSSMSRATTSYFKHSVAASRRPEGSPPLGAKASRRNLVFGWIPHWIRTMKQSFASAARLRGAAPSSIRHRSQVSVRVNRPLGSSSTARRDSAIGRRTKHFRPTRSGCLAQRDACWDFASGDHAPERDEQLPCERHNHCRLARALRTLGPRPVPLRQGAVLLEP